MQILQLPRQDPGPGLSWGWPEAAPLAFLPPAVRRDAACPDTADTGPGLPRYQDYLVFSTLTCTHIMNLWIGITLHSHLLWELFFSTHLFHYIWVNRNINKIFSINIRTVLYLVYQYENSRYELVRQIQQRQVQSVSSWWRCEDMMYPRRCPSLGWEARVGRVATLLPPPPPGRRRPGSPALDTRPGCWAASQNHYH